MPVTPTRLTKETCVSLGLVAMLFLAAYAVYDKVADINANLSGLTERMRGQETGIAEIKVRLDKIQETQEEMRTGLVQLRAEVDSLKK